MYDTDMAIFPFFVPAYENATPPPRNPACNRLLQPQLADQMVASPRLAERVIDVQEVPQLTAPSDGEADDADGAAEFAFKATFDVMKARQGTRRSAFAYVMQRPGTTNYLLTLR